MHQFIGPSDPCNITVPGFLTDDQGETNPAVQGRVHPPSSGGHHPSMKGAEHLWGVVETCPPVLTMLIEGAESQLLKKIIKLLGTKGKEGCG